MFAKPQAFTLHVPEAHIEDLKARLARTRLPDQAPDSRWEYGADLTYMRSLIEYWRTSFDCAHRKQSSMPFHSSRSR